MHTQSTILFNLTNELCLKAIIQIVWSHNKRIDFCLIAGSSIGTCQSNPSYGYPTVPYAFTSMVPSKVATVATAKGALTGTFQVRYEETSGRACSICL